MTPRASDPQAHASERTPSRVGRLISPGSRPLLWIIPAAIAVLIGIAGIFGSRIIRESFREELKNELQTILDADKEALRTWVESQKRVAGLLVSRPGVAESASKIAALAGTTAELRASAPAVELNKALDPQLAPLGFDGYLLADAGGRILAATAPAMIGTRLPAEQAVMLSDVLDGKTRVLPPFALGPASGTATRPAAGQPSLIVAIPVPNVPRGAALAFQIPIEPFTRILSTARLGKTGETYAFDKNGRLLSESRFEDQLRAVGLLGPERSTLAVEIRDPGGNTLEGHRTTTPLRARPLTRMAASATTGGKGIDVDGYPDYRGVPVVGAWEWFPDMDLGVATEVDVAEAYRTINLLSLAFWMLFGAAALAAILLAAGSVMLRRMRRAVHDVTQLGQYTLGTKLGEGAMGRVYRATHAMLRRPTAVKLLKTRDADAIERFEREVQLTSRLSHPNTIAIYDYGRTPDGIFYYAMEYLDGLTLADLVQLEGPVAPSRVVHILRQVCGSLAEAHAKGFVHRDIKPSNIVLSNRGGEPDVVKVLDFGLVKSVDRGNTMLTTMGVVFGTPGFIPPETLQDPTIFGPPGDLYAVGAVGYELLTGQSIFERTTTFEICRKHVEVEPQSPSERLGRPLPPILSAVVMACLAKDPADRPESANALRDMLDSCEDVGPWTRAEAMEWWVARAKDVAAFHPPEEAPDPADPERTIPIDASVRTR